MNENQELPKVTISVINYNDRKFIFQAIESAVNQNYPNLEIIITDNNSTDGTREEIGERIAEWEKKRKKVVNCWFHSPDRAVEPGCRIVYINKLSTIKTACNQVPQGYRHYGTNKQ